MSGPILVVEDVWGKAFDELARTHDVRRMPKVWEDPRALADAVADASALVVRNRTRVTGELLGGAKNLRLVARAGTGLDNIDVAAADDAGVVVCAGRGANARSVAEHTLALALALCRNVPSQDHATRVGAWNRAPGRELSGSTWGLIGLGATGLAVAEMLSGFGMRVIGHDPNRDPGDERLARAKVSLAGIEAVVAAADVLSVHVPVTTSTRGLINAGLLALMKPGALLISVGRGECVDEEALAEALESGRLGGAGLDVRAVEPPVPGRLERLDTVVFSPHVAGITVQSQERIVKMLAGDIRKVLSGLPAEHAVGRVRAARLSAA